MSARRPPFRNSSIWGRFPIFGTWIELPVWAWRATLRAPRHSVAAAAICIRTSYSPAAGRMQSDGRECLGFCNSPVKTQRVVPLLDDPRPAQRSLLLGQREPDGVLHDRQFRRRLRQTARALAAYSRSSSYGGSRNTISAWCRAMVSRHRAGHHGRAPLHLQRSPGSRGSPPAPRGSSPETRRAARRGSTLRSPPRPCPHTHPQRSRLRCASAGCRTASRAAGPASAAWPSPGMLFNRRDRNSPAITRISPPSPGRSAAASDRGCRPPRAAVPPPRAAAR